MYSVADRFCVLGLLTLSIFNGMFQIIGIVSIMPFIAVISDPAIIESNRYIAYIQQYFELETQFSLLIFFGVCTIISIILANLFSTLEYWANLRFFNNYEHIFSVRLLTYFLNLDQEDFYKEKKTNIIKYLLSDVERLLVGSQMALVGLISDLVVFVFIFGLLLVLDVRVTLTATFALGFAYVSIFVLLSRIIKKYGLEQSELESKVYAATIQAIDLYREIKISGKKQTFIQAYAKPSKKLADHSVKYYALSFIPIQIVEILAFSAAVLAALYYTLVDTAALNAITSISVFAFATYRLLPILKSVFEGFETLSFNRETLNNLLVFFKPNEELTNTGKEKIVFNKAISFNNVSFSYKNSESKILHQINFKIEKNSFTCLSGFSGAGKSTLSYLMLGLLRPDSGNITIDGVELSENNRDTWQRSFGYVPQKVQLINGSVLENIAFGEETGNIDVDKVKKVAAIAHIDDFIENALPENYESILGDGGITISGGEKQRIGIARSLYHDPELLFFDESTNELDLTTESRVLKALRDIPGITLIFISHKPSVIALADENIEIPHTGKASDKEVLTK